MPVFSSILILYLSFINLTGFLLFRADKIRARRHRYRIPENRLFLAALLGGAGGCLLGMLCFHHKTRHARFLAGMPLLLLLWILILLFLFRSGLSDRIDVLLQAALFRTAG
jgi:uncharacterized membrane protein YsdA (DUF1294 family)